MSFNYFSGICSSINIIKCVDCLSYSFLPAQISLLEMPQHKRKKMMTLTTNVMRDDNDKVKYILL